MQCVLCYVSHHGIGHIYNTHYCCPFRSLIRKIVPTLVDPHAIAVIFLFLNRIVERVLIKMLQCVVVYLITIAVWYNVHNYMHCVATI